MTSRIKKGRAKPLIDYYLDNRQQIWFMGVDEDGAIYYNGDTAAGRLNAAELATVKNTFDQAGWLGFLEWYSAPNNQRDTLTEQRIIVTYYRDGVERRCDIQTGAALQPELNAIMVKLAQLYDKYAP